MLLEVRFTELMLAARTEKVDIKIYLLPHV